MSKDDGFTRYTVRIPTPLYERVKEAAGASSVNAEVVKALEEKYPAPAPASTRLEALTRLIMTMDRLVETKGRELRAAIKNGESDAVLDQIEAELLDYKDAIADGRRAIDELTSELKDEMRKAQD